MVVMIMNLIFTCSEKNDKKIINMALKNKIKITKVGRIINRKGIFVKGSKIDHFLTTLFNIVF